ncbi:MAG: SpoIIE family protein phosphatase [Spirochaetia bacterium]
MQSKLETQNLDHLFSSIISQIGLGCCIADDSGQIIYVNKYLVDNLCYASEELQGNGFYDILFQSENYKEMVRKKVFTALETPFYDLDTKFTSKDGAQMAVHMTGFPFQHEDEKYTVLFIEDVSKKKAFEKVIESSFDNFIQTTIDLDAAMKKVKEQRKILSDYKQKMIRELEIAKNVQNAIIPKHFPAREKLDIYGTTKTSEELGGDYFDFFHLDDENLGILIADVSGHGVPSSLITTMVKAYFEYYTRRYRSPSTLLYHVNNSMSAILEDTGFYLTAMYCVLNTNDWSLTVSAAGHDSGICICSDKKDVQRIGKEGEGTIIGTFPEAEYTETVYQVQPGSRIVLFTDGIPEARNKLGQFFNVDRLISFCVESYQFDAAHTGGMLLSHVDDFYDGLHPNDDRTLVIFDIDKEEHNHLQKKYISQGLVESLEGLDEVQEEMLLRFYLIREPENVACRYLLGKLCMHQKKLYSAACHLRTALKYDKHEPNILYTLGIVCFNLKHYEEAEKYWQRIKDDEAKAFEKLEEYLAMAQSQQKKKKHSH